MYVGNTMHATLHICCQIQWTQSSLSYAKSRPSQIQRIFSFVYSVLCIQTDVSPHLLLMCRQFDTRYTPHLLPNTGRINWFALCQLWTLYIQLNCCFTYSVSDIWIEVAVWCVIYICRVDVKIWVRVRGVKRIPIGARRDHYAIGEIFTSANMTMMELDK